MDTRLPTGSTKLDAFLEGGYEPSVVTTIFGPSGTGKTTTCLLAAISASQKGKVMFIDSEGGFSTERLKQLTTEYEIVLDKTTLYCPKSFGEQDRCIDVLHAQPFPKGITLIICDTISALYRVERGEDNRGLNAALGRQVGKLLEISRRHAIPILLTNQVYADFSDSTKVRMVGGDIISYNSKCLIELQPIEGSQKKAILRKHRNLPEKEIVFEIRNEGIY